MTESLLAWAERIVGDDSISESGPVKPAARATHDLLESVRADMQRAIDEARVLRERRAEIDEKLRENAARYEALEEIIIRASQPVDKPKRSRGGTEQQQPERNATINECAPQQPQSRETLSLNGDTVAKAAGAA